MMKQHVNIAKVIWHKIISIFSTSPASRTKVEYEIIKPITSTYTDWINTIDVLQPLIQSARNELEPSKLTSYDLEILGASTYLFHVDRLLCKLREHLLNFRFRIDEMKNRDEIYEKTEFKPVVSACEHCYQTMINILPIIKKVSTKRLYSEEFINLIHTLELEISSLGSALRNLNQNIYRQETLFQMAQLEQSLMQALQPSFRDQNLMPSTYSYSSSEQLRSKLLNILDVNHLKLANSIVDLYDNLSKCYVIARKSVIKETLDQMARNIEELIMELSNQKNEKQVIHNLTEIYNAIESLRFGSNRESRCSKNLFEKAKQARSQLRKACMNHSMGQDFIKSIAVTRTTLIKKLK